jgi:hypothetical protein
MAIHSRVAWLLPCLLWLRAAGLEAAPLNNGHLSVAVHDVRIGRITAPTGTPIADALLETGRDSRAEVTFSDQTVVRLGNNTKVAVDPGNRTFDLQAGAVLAQVASGVGGTKLKVLGITATVTGTTLVVEFLPNAYTKFIALDGTSRLCLKKGGWGSDCTLLRAGQMMIASPDPKMLPDAVDVDLSRLLDTSDFITRFSSLPDRDRVVKAAAAQRARKNHGSFAETNLVIFGRGTVVTQKPVGNGPPATPAKTAGVSAGPIRAAQNGEPSP